MHDLPISIIEDELPSKSQIQFLFSLLQERMFQTKELPIEDVEEICYNARQDLMSNIGVSFVIISNRLELYNNEDYY